MGERQRTLAQLLREAGCQVGCGGLLRPSEHVRGANTEALWAEVFRVYRRLGGALNACPLRVGTWDVEVGKVAIELDEEQHFNRYRALTLESSLYAEMPSFPLAVYRSQCELHESACAAKASNCGYWSSDSTIKQFGPAGEPGDLGEHGSPRWKQRAFYDFLKDLAPDITGTIVARISVWDMLDVGDTPRRVAEVLDRRLRAGVPALIKLLERRCDTDLSA